MRFAGSEKTEFDKQKLKNTVKPIAPEPIYIDSQMMPYFQVREWCKNNSFKRSFNKESTKYTQPNE